MTATENQTTSEPSSLPRSRGLKLWHLVVLVAFTAIAIANIQDHRLQEPKLIVLAVVGFVVYAAVGVWLWGWMGARREELGGQKRVVCLYVAAMAFFFWVSTLAFVGLEMAYRGGWF